jgi:hypothetical protein
MDPLIDPLEPRQLLAGFSFSINDIAIFEGDSGSSLAVFTVAFSGFNSLGGASVQYSTADGSAKAGIDYTPTSGQLIFGPGVRARTIAVPILGDTLADGDKQFVVNLFNAAGANIADGQGQATIVDDDGATVTVSASDNKAVEGGKDNGSFKITRDGSTAAPLRVNYSLLGTAANGIDYVRLTGKVTIPRGKSSASVKVSALADTLAEGNEIVTLRLSKSSAYAIGSAKQARVTIVDGDSTPPLAALNAPAITAASANPYQFTVIYTDAKLVKARSIGDGDLRVTGPNGYSQLATLVSKSPARNARTITATYSVPAPAGQWDVADNGLYTVSVIASQVRDRAGNFIAAGALGTFNVNIPAVHPMASNFGTSPIAFDDGDKGDILP